MIKVSETQFVKPADVNAAQIFCKEEYYETASVADVKEGEKAKKPVKVKTGKTYESGQTAAVPMNQICFSVKEGEVIFSDKWKDLEPVLNIVDAFKLDKVLEDLFIRKENVHSAAIYNKEEKVKVAVKFKFGTPVYAGPFENSEAAEKWILDTF